MFRSATTFASLLLAACNGAPSAETDRGLASEAAAAPAAPASTSAPGTLDCLPIVQIREARPVGDERIEFETIGGATYINTLPHSCPGLGFNRAFTYSTSLTQLCSTDIIRVVQQAGGPTLGAACGLGDFVPVAPAQ